MLGYMAKGIKVANGVNVTNQMTLSWGEYPGLYGWVQYNHSRLLSVDERQREPEREEYEKNLPNIASFEDGGRSHENVGSPYKQGGSKNRFSTRASRTKHGPTNTGVIAHSRLLSHQTVKS